jgi:hypothetical protein
VSMLLEALSDAWGRSGPLAFVAHWRAALAGLDERPAALIYCAALVAIVVLMFAGPRGRRVGYRRGPFLSVNEKSFLRALDVALGRDLEGLTRRLCIARHERPQSPSGTTVSVRRGRFARRAQRLAAMVPLSSGSRIHR